jgi:sialate O-acetylesterase
MKTLLLLISLMPCLAHAELTVPHFFSDHMVLQRERAVAIWGKANALAEVKVEFKGKSAQTKADADGKWRVQLETGAADAKGATMLIQSGAEKKEIVDVLVGEVWFASGQSNMSYQMKGSPQYADLTKKSTHPNLRMFDAPRVTAVHAQEDIASKWAAATPETVPNFSAVAFFFARKLHLDLGIPIGVINSSWGGKPVETFTSREALNTLPGTKALVDAAIKADANYDEKKAQAAYQVQLKKWQEMTQQAAKKPANQRGNVAPRPAPPKRPLDLEGKPGVLFNAMIHPFIGYTMRGAIWYQGEGNANVNAVPYDLTLPLMINDWRKRWNDDFSFYYVQLANFQQPSTAPGTAHPWPLLQDRMRLVLATTPKTGMAIINDVGAANDIHPKNKKDPGERLALWALAKDYGKDITYSGPLYQSNEIKGDAIRVTFAQSGTGLKSRDGGELKRFEIAGADQKWHWAEAKIDGKDSVMVRSAEVKQPVAVRYAWAANPEGSNLVNSEGLPTSVFRTDDWADALKAQAQTQASPAPSKALADRRALGAEIRSLNAKRKALKPNSQEHKVLTQKINALMMQFNAMSPAKSR